MLVGSDLGPLVWDNAEKLISGMPDYRPTGGSGGSKAGLLKSGQFSLSKFFGQQL